MPDCDRSGFDFCRPMSSPVGFKGDEKHRRSPACCESKVRQDMQRAAYNLLQPFGWCQGFQRWVLYARCASHHRS